MRRVALEPAYVLHRRPYRETSFLVDLFTPEHGRITLIAKGIRQAKSASQGLLQPFTPVNASWAGKSELMTLTQVEARDACKQLKGDALFAGFYLNELIISLLEKFDPHPVLFKAYEDTLTALQTLPLNQQALRTFEKVLLGELGYGLLADGNTMHNEAFLPGKYYRFVPEQGFILSELGEDAKDKPTLFAGESLLAIMNDDWQHTDSMRDAKRLTRFLLAPLLGNRQIHSRKLFMQPEEVRHDEE